jgi:hypothetical protein
MIFVIKKRYAHYSPHVILKIGIKKVHPPFGTWRRKTTQKQKNRIGWQKGLQRMNFDSIIVHVLIFPHAFCDADKVMFIKHYGQNQRLWITKKWIVST